MVQVTQLVFPPSVQIVHAVAPSTKYPYAHTVQTDALVQLVQLAEQAKHEVAESRKNPLTQV